MVSVTQAVEDLCRAAVRLPDEAMDRPWAWGEYDSEGLRFALLMAQHELRDLAARLEAARGMAGRPPGESERVRAQYHEAYRDLTGLLHRVREDELDREPAPGQWPVREAIGHMIGAVYGFSAVVDLAMDAHARGVAQGEPSDEEFAKAKGQPEPTDRIAGGDVRAVAKVLFEAHKRARRAMSRVTDDDLERPALFWDGPMLLRFRLHRFEAHMRQHTIQVEKTLLAIGHPATEAERLVRLIHNGLAGVESASVDGIGDAERDAVAASIAPRVAAMRSG
jgi:hypothetical protein